MHAYMHGVVSVTQILLIINIHPSLYKTVYDISHMIQLVHASCLITTTTLAMRSGTLLGKFIHGCLVRC